MPAAGKYSYHICGREALGEECELVFNLLHLVESLALVELVDDDRLTSLGEEAMACEEEYQEVVLTRFERRDDLLKHLVDLGTCWVV